MDGPRDGRAVHAVEDGEGGVRKPETQDHQGRDHPVSEDQLMAGPAASARRRSWPRRSPSRDSSRTIHGTANSATSAPSRRLDMPVQIRCERAVRAKEDVTVSPTRTALLTFHISRNRCCPVPLIP